MTNRTDLGLLLLHALPFDSEMWAEQTSLLSTHIYTPNLYNFGDDIETWAKGALAAVTEPNVIVVGCSVGGSCALEIAKLAPARIAALVLIGTKARHDPNPTSYQNALKLLKDQGVEAAWKVYWEPLFQYQRGAISLEVAKKIALRQSSNDLANGLSAFHNRPNQDNLVSKLDFPVHVVTGEEDELPGVKYSTHLAKTAKNGQLHVFKSCGHYVPMEKPQELNALLKVIIGIHS